MFFTINPCSVERETLTTEQINEAARNRRPFRTAQLWGAPLTATLYAIGSSAEANDNDEPRILAIVNWQGDLIASTPLTYLPGIRAMISEPTEADRPDGDALRNPVGDTDGMTCPKCGNDDSDRISQVRVQYGRISRRCMACQHTSDIAA